MRAAHQILLKRRFQCLIFCSLAATAWSLTGCSKTPATPRQQLDVVFKSADWLATVDLSTKLLQASPDDAELLRYRAQSYLALKMYDESVADFTQVIKLAPEESNGYFGREMAYRRSGKMDLADADGKKGREIDIDYKTAYKFDIKNFAAPSELGEDALLSHDSGDAPRDNGSESPFDTQRDSADSMANSPKQSDPWNTDGNNEVAADDGLYDPINEAASILDRAMSNADDSDASVAGTPKVTEPYATEPNVSEPKINEFDDPASELAANMARLQSGNLGSNAADDPDDELLDDKDIAEIVRRRLNRKNEVPRGDAIVGPKPFVPDEPTSLPDTLVLPPRPTISTAIPTAPTGNSIPGSIRPLGIPSAPGVTAPRATGISSRPPTTTLPATPIRSAGTPGIAGTPQSTGFQPGQFQGNTIYTPGSPRPTLSTSIPGTGPQIPSSAPGFVPKRLTNGNGGLQRRGPVLSTQLPANRAVAPGATARPTGIISGGR